MKSSHHFLSSLFFLIASCCASAAPEHPRLLVTEADWKALPAKMESESIVRKIIGTTIARADSVLAEPPLTRTVTGRRMLGVSRETIQRVLDLSTAWKISGERKYLDRCREELLNACSFTDWNPDHHLDTAEMQTAVAIGYDWLYHELSAQDRATIGKALLEKGLKLTLGRDDIMRRENNWNQVCMGGMVLSAVALMEVEPEMAEKALAAARKAIGNGLEGGYSKKGAYSEGGGYWQYGTEFSILTAEALRTAGLPDAGIISHPGFLESGDFIVQVHGTSGLLFNYGDTTPRPMGASPAAAWMARETGSAALRELIAPAFGNLDPERSSRLLALGAFWFPSPGQVRENKLPLHYRGGGHSPIAIHRTGFEAEDLFLGIKAGKAKVNHGHMDAGSFVIDRAGERWAEDLGKQDYHPLEETGMSLFDMSQESRRWSVFRLNNFSHNTLTYNGKPHRVEGAAEIVSSEGVPEQTTLVDMTAPLGLPEGAKAARRFTMSKETVTVVDELEGLDSGDRIAWHMITRAEASRREGGFSLEQNGKRMSLSLSSSRTVSSDSVPADPPAAEYDESNLGMTRITLDAKADRRGRIRVVAVFGTEN